MINKVQSLKGKTKIKIHKNLSNFCDEMNIRTFKFEEGTSCKIARSISETYHEVLFSLKFYRLNLRLGIKLLNIMIYNILLSKIVMKRKL